MAARNKAETGSTNSGRKNGKRAEKSAGLENPDLLLKEWKKQNLLNLAKQIYQLDRDIEHLKPGSRLHDLKRLVVTYNLALKDVFGEETAKILPNLRIIGAEVHAFIPRVETNIDGTQKKTEKKGMKGNKNKPSFGKSIDLDQLNGIKQNVAPELRGNSGKQIIEFFDEGNIPFDSEEVIMKMIAEESQHTNRGKLKLFYADSIPVGAAYLIIVDPQTEKEHFMRCSFEEEKIEISKITIDLFIENGFSVSVVVSPNDLASGFVRPPNQLSLLN